ncbi:hypothetical protein GCM10023149_18340 [Mucilaginibacter gynuensis]|uniref:DUF3857 domain-containing protein n=1 Tax=Mucilaginibacter gynuensis TaxID=1302236 RepID=A0ABP8G8M6_9SPHI
MKACIMLLVFVLAMQLASAQIKPYGKVDTADLKLKECDFEKGAGAMVLFDRGDLRSLAKSTLLIRHKRIKILSDAGKDKANITLSYISKSGFENITDIEAQTINLTGNTIQYIPVDKKQIYIQKADKYRKTITFSFPAVKQGSIVEFRYKWSTTYEHYPVWEFQADIPVRYSELVTNFKSPVDVYTRKIQEFTKSTSERLGPKYWPVKVSNTWAMANVPSLVDEPLMPATDNNLQRISFFDDLYTTWPVLGEMLLAANKFGGQFNSYLKNEEDIIVKADQVVNRAKKIEMLFETVKNTLTWNGSDDCFTAIGVKEAWNKRTGNATEINLVLYNLLRHAGVTCYPAIISTPDNGEVEVDYPSLAQFNKTIVYVPVDSASYYILDATNKRNKYNEVPYSMLNLTAMAVNPKGDIITSEEVIAAKDAVQPEASRTSLFVIRNMSPTKDAVYIDAEISADGKMTGTAHVASNGYSRGLILKRDDLKKESYKQYLKQGNNNLKIESVRFDNAETDSLPLRQDIGFELDMTGSGHDDYLYLNPNIFSAYMVNPFLSENRYSDIEFLYASNYAITGNYKLPPGYKAETLPKNTVIRMDDHSISIKRLIEQTDDHINVSYTINRSRVFYKKEEYGGLKQFYKSLTEILNEPIVLKKAVSR